MKRLIYMSAFARDISDEEINELGRRANERNNARNITGVLLCLEKTFFQILEGDNWAIDALFESIKRDPRHRDVVCLINDGHVYDRCFPGRYMHTINLNRNRDMLVQPVKVLLQRLTESHRIIGKYTQPAVINSLVEGCNPLDLIPKRCMRVVLFTDIRGFSRLSERYPVDEVVRLVNCFLEAVTEVITSEGGEVTKYIGDCVMAHFREEQADGALHAASRILETLAAIRSEAPADSAASRLFAGIGMDFGEVIQGNVGSSVKMDYTLLGGVVNRAQGLERLTRKLPVSLIFSQEVKAAANQPWEFLPLGKHAVKGRQEELDLFSLDMPLVHAIAPFDDGQETREEDAACL